MDRPVATHNTHKTQTAMPQAVFELVIPESERPQNHTLDRAANEIGKKVILLGLMYHMM